MSYLGEWITMDGHYAKVRREVSSNERYRWQGTAYDMRGIGVPCAWDSQGDEVDDPNLSLRQRRRGPDDPAFQQFSEIINKINLWEKSDPSTQPASLESPHSQ